MEAKLQEEVKKPSIAEMVSTLHDLRLHQDGLKAQKQAIYAAIDEQNKELLGDITGTGEAIVTLELLIKTEAVAAYDLTGEKKPAAGVQVKDITSYEYPEAEGLQWAKSHNHAGLVMPERLDTKAFEKDICKSDALRPDFVTVKTTPRAEIASDLAKALEVS